MGHPQPVVFNYPPALRLPCTIGSVYLLSKPSISVRVTLGQDHVYSSLSTGPVLFGRCRGFLPV